MIKICFVCLGNICRSPMAEFIMKKKIKDLNLESEISITSRATSYEEQGNDIYPSAKRKLSEKNIPYSKHQATCLEPNDYDKYDYFICMEQRNVNNTLRIFSKDPKNKIIRLLDLTATPKDIEDPWYTDDFDVTYDELNYGIEKLIEILLKK